MAERTERAVLNTLIVTCRDADRGFMFAADHVKDRGLRTLLVDLAKERREFAEALIPHANRLGGEGVADGTALATLHRAWMAVKDRVAHQDQAIVAEAERGERAALAAYDEAIAGMLPPETRDLVETQRAAVEASLGRIRAVGIAAA